MLSLSQEGLNLEHDRYCDLLFINPYVCLACTIMSVNKYRKCLSSYAYSSCRRDDLSSGEVTSDGDSDDSDSWRQNRVRTMLQSHVAKPSNDERQRETYEK